MNPKLYELLMDKTKGVDDRSEEYSNLLVIIIIIGL